MIYTVLCMHSSDVPTVTHINCPQQNNGYDCGIYVLIFTEIIARLYLMSENCLPSPDIIESTLYQVVNTSSTSKLRESMKLFCTNRASI